MSLPGYVVCRDIPGWKQRIAGKSIPMEKFAVKKCERFFAQGNKLILPAVELLYLWNGFKVLGKQMDLVQPLLSLIQSNIKYLGMEKGSHPTIHSFLAFSSSLLSVLSLSHHFVFIIAYFMEAGLSKCKLLYFWLITND